MEPASSLRHVGKQQRRSMRHGVEENLASVRQTRRAEKTPVAQNEWRQASGYPASAQAPTRQTRRAEKTSVAQNEWWQARGFPAGALATPREALPKATLAYR